MKPFLPVLEGRRQKPKREVSDLTPFPVATLGAPIFERGGELHVVGYQADTAIANRFHFKYAEAENEWVAQEAYDTYNVKLGAAVTTGGGRSFVLGGFNGDGFRVLEYLGGGTWVNPAIIDSANNRIQLGACAYEGEVFYFGGQVYPGYTLHPSGEGAYDPDTQTERSIANLPARRASFGYELMSEAGELLIFGGAGDVVGDEVLVYDFAADTWAERTKMPGARSGHSALRIGDTIYLIGGRDANNVMLPNLWAYDLKTGACEETDIMLNVPRRDGFAFSLSDGTSYYGAGADADGNETNIVEGIDL